MEFTDVKAPEPVDGSPPWRDPRWIAEAEALRIAPLARALTWGRVFPCFLGHPATAAYAARSLAALLKPDPLAPS